MSGDIENPITVRGPDRANRDVTPDFFCEMAFHYYHPGALRKVSRNHGEATGEWYIRPLEAEQKLLQSLSKGMDYKKTILDIIFNYRGG